MQSLAIVPSLDKFKDRGFVFGDCFELFKNALSFQGCVKTLDDSIILAIANPTHTHLALFGCKQRSIGFTGVLTAMVSRVQNAWQMAVANRQSAHNLLHHTDIHAVVHRPTHNAA